MIEMNSNDKKDILLVVLAERYEAMRVIRERVQNVCVWALGLLVGGAAWLVQSDILIDAREKLYYLILISIALGVLRINYLGDLQKGFSSQQRVAVKVEKALGLYAAHHFDDSEESIYPTGWEKAGKENSSGNFFSSTYLLLYVGFAILALAILFHPECYFFMEYQ